MSQLNDVKFTALGDQGYTGSVNDRYLQWLLDNGATSTSIPDAERELLIANGYWVNDQSQLNDAWFAFLGDLGYPQESLNERWFGFWDDGGTLGPPAIPNWDVDPPAVIDGNTDVPYSYDLRNDLNTTAQVTITVETGTLPDGLFISGSRIVGTPTTIETQSGITLRAENPSGFDVSLPFDISIAFGAVFWDTQPAPPDPVENVFYEYDLTPHLNGTENVTVSVTSGALPPGLSIVGLSITGTPTQTGIFINIRLTAFSPFNSDQSDAFSMTVLDAPPIAPVWTTDPPVLAAAQLGQPYFYDFTSDLNTVEGVVITQTGIGNLPAGISIVGVTLQGTPTVSGLFDDLQFTAANVSGSAQSLTTFLDVAIAPPVWQTQPNAPDALVNVPYSYDLGGNLDSTSGVSIAVTQGSLPVGLFINPTTLFIEGTPEVIRTETGIVYTATNSSGSTDSAPDSIDIFPLAPNWDTQPSPPIGTVGNSYFYDLAQHLNTTAGVVITVTGGSLPPGLSIVNVSIQGTPTTDGTYSGIILTATNTSGSDATSPFSIEIAIDVQVVVRLDNPVQNGKEVFDDGNESTLVPEPPDPPTTDDDADFLYRASRDRVVWAHPFSSPDEVDSFRWRGGFPPGGNNPDDLLPTPGTVRHNTVDFVSGGGSMEINRPAGSDESSVWWRQFSALSGFGVGLNPAAGGDVPIGAWNPTQQGNETFNWDGGDYGPESTGTWEGDQFWLQLQMKLDQRRFDDGTLGGKIQYLTRVEKSLTAQEIVTTYVGSPPDFRLYRQGSPSISSDIPFVEHVAPWHNFMYHIVPGDEDEGGSDTGGNTQVNVYRQDWQGGQLGWTKIFEKYDLGIDYSNAYKKAWNALILSIYHNGINIGTDFFQLYDEVIFARGHGPIPPKKTFVNSALRTACDALNPGDWVIDAIAQNPNSNDYDVSWQSTSTWWDDMRCEMHYMGKKQGGGRARHHIYNEQTNTYRITGTDIAPGKLGHIWGNTFDHFRGRQYYIPQDPAPEFERTILYLDRELENGQGTTNDPWKQLPAASFDLWSPGTNNIYQGGLGYHPNLLGVGRPGILCIAVNQYAYFDERNDEFVLSPISTSGTYRFRHGCPTVYIPGHDVLLCGNGTTGSSDISYMIINPGDANNTVNPEIVSTVPISVRTGTGNYGKFVLDPRDDKKVLILEARGERVWSSIDAGRTWVLENYTHPFWTEGVANNIVADADGGTWAPTGIPRYDGVIIANCQRAGPTTHHTMIWRPE